MIFGAVMALSSSIWIPCLAAVLVIMSAVVTALAAYNLYVDGRFLFDKQLNDIKAGIDFVTLYPNANIADQDIDSKRDKQQEFPSASAISSPISTNDSVYRPM